MYKIGEFATATGLSKNTLRAWDKSGKLKPAFTTDAGHRFYSDEQLNRILGKKIKERERVNVGYCGVTNSERRDDLKIQTEEMRAYLMAKGEPFEIITDIGDNEGLKELVYLIEKNAILNLVVAHKSKIMKYGFELLECVTKHHNTNIEIINKIDKMEDQVLIEELVQIVSAFANEMSGERQDNIKKLITAMENSL